MSLVSNERIKYLATLINTVAAASVTVGVVAPLVALTYGVPGPLGSGFTVLIGLAWFLAGWPYISASDFSWESCGNDPASLVRSRGRTVVSRGRGERRGLFSNPL